METPRGPQYIGVLLVAVMMVAAVGALVYVAQAPTQQLPDSLAIPYAATEAVAFDIGPFNRVCPQYVDEIGLVNYSALQADPHDLQVFLDQLAKVSPHSNIATFTSKNEALAYWINAYNAWMIKAVLDAYPIDSVQDISQDPDVFEAKGRICGGESLSLNDIEHELVRKEFALEPRIHFVLNCASLGCPWLPQEAFTPQRLDEQLDREMLRFYRDPTHLGVDVEAKTVHLSAYFDWYGEDFLRWLREVKGFGNPTVLDYVRLTAPEDIAKQIGDDFAVEFVEYDWRLNDQDAQWAHLRHDE